MSDVKMVNGKIVPLTPVEIEERKKAQEQYEAEAPLRAREAAIAQRVARYAAESDGLYMGAVFDAAKNGVEPDLTEWKTKVEEIKAEIPLS